MDQSLVLAKRARTGAQQRLQIRFNKILKKISGTGLWIGEKMRLPSAPRT